MLWFKNRKCMGFVLFTRPTKGASKTRDPRSEPKLRHTRPRQHGLGCGGAPQAVTWIPVSVSVDTPRHVTGAAWHSKSATHGRTRDGRRNYEHFVTAYDVHFIVNNKYYAMKIQEKSESFPEIPEIPWIRSNYLDVRIFRYPISTRISTISTNIYSPPKFSRIWHTRAL